jgi:YggT family protein
MNPVTSSIVLIVSVFFNLLMLVLLLRFLLQWVGADFYNPVSQAIARITTPLLAPLKRIIPSRGSFDGAALLLLFLGEILAIVVMGFLHGRGLINPVAILLWAPLGIISLFLRFYFFAILAMVVLSWIAPGNPSPVIHLLYQLVEPVMAPFRRLLPAMGGLDLSPIFVFVAIMIAQNFVAYAAQRAQLIPSLVIGF